MSNLKDQIKLLMNDRTKIEDEISLCSAKLEAAGVGLKGSLVDSEVKGLLVACRSIAISDSSSELSFTVNWLRTYAHSVSHHA